MTAWSEVRDKIVAMLGTRANRIETPDILTWWNQAQRNFAIRHTALESIQSYDGDDSAREFDLPPNFIKEYGIYDDDNSMFLEPGSFKPGIAWDEEVEDNTTRRYGYILWPAGKVTLFRTPETGTGNIKLYYWAFYPDLVDDTDTIATPAWAEEALIFYTLALSLVPAFQATADVRQWNERVDSGRPTDNPLLQSFNALVKQYHETLSLWPKQVRDHYYYSGGRSV